MNKAQIIGLSLFLTGTLFSCSSKGDGSVTAVDLGNGNTLTLCDFSLVGDTIDVPLSEWVEDCKLVRFENGDTALFKFWAPAITDNYIGIRQDGGVFKLFNHDGKFLADIGKIGQGPGEYAGSLYGEVIDEQNKSVYLAPFYGSRKLLKYNIDGTYAADIEIGEELNKPKIALNEDGSLSMVHLCFQGRNKIFAARIDKDGKVTTFDAKPDNVINPFDKDGAFVGFNNEIWASNNVSGMSYMPMPKDTLYMLDAQNGVTIPRFALSNKPKGDDVFFIFNELPQKYIATWWGKGTVAIDKATNTSHFIRLKNDSFGGLKAPTNFSNGYFFAMYEPLQLMDEIEKRLSESDCTDQDKKVLNELLESLNENDNNLMFIGKLKK